MSQGSLNPNIRFLEQKVCPVARRHTRKWNTKMTLKMSFFKISKNKKMRFFLMSQGPFSPKIRFLGQKVSSVARRQTDRKVKMVLKIPFFKISKNKKLSFFLMSQGSFSPKIRFLCQKVCSVARTQTDRQTRKWIQRTPFQGFRIFQIFLQPIIKERSNIKQTLAGVRHTF